ncbi:ArsR/SmtB family transcription factor [Levilactobacillus tujiorum]|uniref:Winged helix-turn-helix transcriptional regulator n=1 Tax=Levilactobacillus tujiorum TaxID=2912243 RepID=A0ABX1L800_9LACO|nr:metalloregulator ArsR/SmtB family transcription factor [Levilactobacillus tujiorum]MCH5465410.1 metalloregulator ArsR/SmtB family transcription factor [Levilactobacillus tujiorum]NLR12343.1 winged helix-turn-helix transcriptional regulator [Lactobacillus sp. HBUAS51387]NLR30413.1 winged helix-turn-helix transcriptional regulator [Levilactobacillus tujiorum]
MNYTDYAKFFKAMGDRSRLKIIDMLSCGEMCACDILKHFDFTQPTLSHHMKVLQVAGIVNAEKNGKWQYYSLNQKFVTNFPEFTHQLLQSKESCVCRATIKDEGCDECGLEIAGD